MEQEALCNHLAKQAVAALIEEVELTPKPGLVDQANNGAHLDLTVALMKSSANALFHMFYEMAMLSFDQAPTVTLREQFGAIGREGEKAMFAVTNNVNTHKGAIWSIGLLCSAIARKRGAISVPQLFYDAAELAQLPDKWIPNLQTNGRKVKMNYNLTGAREEAQQAFPHIRLLSYPILKEAMQQMSVREAKIYTLVRLIAELNDTCIAHRGGISGLRFAQKEARHVLHDFSMEQVLALDCTFYKEWLSPGGSADLLAATLFIINLEKWGVQDGKVGVYVSSGTTSS